MIPKTFIDYYGDETRWFLGEVVDVNDPKKIGRVKVRVFGVYDAKKENEYLIAEKDLPWAQIVVPITQGVHKGKGQYLGLLEGTQVFGMFLDGKNSQLPMVIGTVPKEGDENSRAKANYPHNKIYQTERGHYKEYDDTEDNERIREEHRKGTYYEMDKDGNMTIYAHGNVTIEANGEKVTVKGKKIEVNGELVDITGGQNIKLNS